MTGGYYSTANMFFIKYYFYFSWGEDGYVRLSRENPDGCGTNNTPMDGTACVGGPGSQGQKVAQILLWNYG